MFQLAETFPWMDAGQILTCLPLHCAHHVTWDLVFTCQKHWRRPHCQECRTTNKKEELMIIHIYVPSMCSHGYHNREILQHCLFIIRSARDKEHETNREEVSGCHWHGRRSDILKRDVCSQLFTIHRDNWNLPVSLSHPWGEGEG